MLKKIMALTIICWINLQISAVDKEIKNIENAKEAQTISYYNDNAQTWIDTYGANIEQSYWIEEINIFKKYIKSFIFFLKQNRNFFRLPD